MEVKDKGKRMFPWPGEFKVSSKCLVKCDTSMLGNNN